MPENTFFNKMGDHFVFTNKFVVVELNTNELEINKIELGLVIFARQKCVIRKTLINYQDCILQFGISLHPSLEDIISFLVLYTRVLLTNFGRCIINFFFFIKSMQERAHR